MIKRLKGFLSLLICFSLVILSCGLITPKADTDVIHNAYEMDAMSVSAILAKGPDDLSVSVIGNFDDGKTCIINTYSGTVIKIASVDFGEKGPGKAFIRGNTGIADGFAAELRLDSPTGTLLGTFERSTATDGGWSAGLKEVAAETEITTSVTGVHTIYIVYKRSALNFFGIYFEEYQEAPVPQISVDAYNPDEMRVPWFGMGATWLEGSGLNLMTVDGATDGDYCVVNITTETVISIANVNFGNNGPTKAFLRGNTGGTTGFAAELRLDSPTGTLLCTLERDTPTDGGWDSGVENVAAEAEITEAVTGYHKICIVYTRGAMNFHGIYFEESQKSSDLVEPEVWVDAYNPDEMRVPWFGMGVTWLEGSGLNLMTVDGATDGDYCVTNITTETVISIANVNFGQNGPSKVKINGNSGSSSGFKAEVYLDSPTGALIATLERTSATDGGWSSGVENIAAEAEITQNITGYHTVYIVYSKGSMNFYGLSFDEKDQGPDQEPDQEPENPPEEEVESKINATISRGILVKDYGQNSSYPIISVFSGPGNDGGYVIGSVNTSTVIKISGVDFGTAGATKASFHANCGNATGFTVELHADSPDGTLLGTFTRSTATDGGWDSGAPDKAAEFNMDTSFTGVHNLYLVVTRGAFNFYGIYFYGATIEQPEKEDTVISKPVGSAQVNAYIFGGITVQGYGAKTGTGILTVANGKGEDGGYVISDTAPGSIFEILGVDFGKTGALSASLCGNTGHNGGFYIEVRLDSTAGTLIGTFTRGYSTPGGWNSGADSVAAEFDIDKPVTGVHNVYLILKDGYLNFHSVSFEEKEGEIEPAKSLVDAYVDGGLNVPTFGKAGSKRLITTQVPPGNDNGYIITDARPGSVLKISGVDFGNNSPIAAYIYANTGHNDGFTVEMRLDSPKGKLLGAFTRPNATDGGWSSGVDKVAASFKIDDQITGAHNIFLVIKEGFLNFYGIAFDSLAKKAYELPDVKDAVYKVSAYEDGGIIVPYYGVGAGGDIISVVAGKGTNGDYIISDTAPGTIIEFLGIDFKDISPTRIALFGNTGHQGLTKIELRADSAEGTLIGTFEITEPTSGGWSSGADSEMTYFNCDTVLNGVHNLYLVFVDGYANIYGLVFEVEDPNAVEEVKMLKIPKELQMTATSEPVSIAKQIPIIAAVAVAVILLGGFIGFISGTMVKRKRKINKTQ